MKSLNSVTLVGRVGADVKITPLQNGQQVATFSIATDDSYKDRNGEWQNRTDWHRVVTFQKGLIGILQKHAVKGRLVCVQGMIKNRSYTDADGIKRYVTEVQLNPVNSQVQFLDKLEDYIDVSDAKQPEGDNPPSTYDDDEIPF